MKTRVIPNGVRDLPQTDGARSLPSVIKVPWVRSLALLGMTACVIWLALPKPPLPLREISPALIDATLRFEDKYYRHHPGVNPVALLRSALNLRPGHAQNGASTITMQLARLRYHLRTRTLGGKFVQIARALELERHYSKAQILEAYLNLAPYGRNIEGVGAATQIYFGKTAAHLTRPESISLSVIPQSPTRRALFVDRDNRSLNAALSRFGRRDARLPYSQDDYATLARDFRPRALSEHKLLAPHFVQQVLTAEKGRDEIVATLDLAKQQLIERRIADYLCSKQSRSRNSECCRAAGRHAQHGGAGTGRLGGFLQR